MVNSIKLGKLNTYNIGKKNLVIFDRNKLIKIKNNNNEEIFKLWQRNSKIPFIFLQAKLLIHNGKEFMPFNFYLKHLGFRIGEFVFTRRKPMHTISLKRGGKKVFRIRAWKFNRNG